MASRVRMVYLWVACPLQAARNHPVVQIVFGDALADVAELAELFLGNFLGIAFERFLNGCFVQHGTHLVRFLANGRGDLLTGVLSYFSPIFSPKRKFLFQIEEKSVFFLALAPAVPGTPRRTGDALISGPFSLPATSTSSRDFPSESTMNQTLEIQ